VTASELAFLGLGLLLGAATGAALIVVLGTRSPRREIRVTVTRDALPRRSETLSQDAFVTSPSEPARGGPADRRGSDRDEPALDSRGTPGVPVMGQKIAIGRPVGGFFGPSLADSDRTSVPFIAGAAALAEARELAPDEVRPLDDGQPGPAPLSPLERMLRGEHRAMVEVVDAVAGQDSARRRDWELLLGGLVEAMADMATHESVIDFPMGTAFWDTFTVEQCRRIVAALSSMGFRYDGRSGWVEHHVPVYRDITNALADIGVDPRRMRAWPNQAEIAALFNGARPAPDELLAAAGPDYRVEDMQMLLGEHASGLAGLWIAWNEVRPALLGAGSQAEGALA
jgi:hypothetical protein